MDIKRLLPSIKEILMFDLKSLGVICHWNTENVTECYRIRPYKHEKSSRYT